MKKGLLLAFFIVLASHSFGQHLPDVGMHRIHIDRNNLTADAEILPVNAPTHPDPLRWYYWFAGGEIRHTQGGFSGHLLNGVYHSYYNNGSLMETGVFRTGLKDGEWKSWNEGGTLKQQTMWQNGRRSGIFMQFDEAGKLLQKGTYKDDLLDGRIEAYPSADSTVTTWYHLGKVLTHRPLLKRLNIFKRNRRDTTAVGTKN